MVGNDLRHAVATPAHRAGNTLLSSLAVYVGYIEHEILHGVILLRYGCRTKYKP